MAYDKEVRDAGIFVHEGFHAADTGRTVSVRDGSAEVTDGGVVRAGDSLAGVYVVDVSDLDSATRWAERTPPLDTARLKYNRSSNTKADPCNLTLDHRTIEKGTSS